MDKHEIINEFVGHIRDWETTIEDPDEEQALPTLEMLQYANVKEAMTEAFDNVEELVGMFERLVSPERLNDMNDCVRILRAAIWEYYRIDAENNGINLKE